MRQRLRNLKPKSGFSYFLHLGLVLVLPVAIFVLVRLHFVQLALSIVVLSKWRMFAVRPRFWAANIRANAVDLMVGLSSVIFMTHSGSILLQFMWASLYAIWLLVLKPGSSLSLVTAQAGIGQLYALSALYLTLAAGSSLELTALSGIFCFLAARHFLDIFEEPYARMLAYVWGYFGAALAWLLSHLLLTYSFITQPTLLLSTIGYGLAVLYYLDHTDKLSRQVQRQFVFVMIAIVVVVIAFSNWELKVA